MYVNIEDLLIERKKTLSWLANEINVSQSRLWKISHNQTESINLNMLENICKVLECGVEDVLVIEKSKSQI